MVFSLLLCLLIPSGNGFLTPSVPSSPFLSPSFGGTPLSPSCRSRSRTRTRARTPVSLLAWSEPEYGECTVLSRASGSGNGSLSVVKVDVGERGVREFKVPGQYVMCKSLEGGEGEKAGFYAISSPPGNVGDAVDGNGDGDGNLDASPIDASPIDASPSSSGTTLEFLIKDAPEYISPGQKIKMSPPMGSGFPVSDKLLSLSNDFPTQDVLMFACGSGVAPIRSVIESGILTGEKRNLSLFVGVREISDLAYSDRFADWKVKYGLTNIIVCVSRGEEGLELGEGVDAECYSGYVQNALEEMGAVVVPRNTGVLLCGMKGMVEAVSDICVKKGVTKDRCLTNF